MSVGPLTILEGVGGKEVTKVVSGDDDDHILISQQNKVLVMRVSESAILQSWYSSPNQLVIAAANNQDHFLNCNCVIAYDENTVACVNNLGSKLPAFEKTRLSRNIFDVFAVKGDHLVVFVDGTVGSLRGLVKGHEEGDFAPWYSPAILNSTTDTLLDAFLLADGPVSIVVLIAKSGNQLKLYHGRLSLGEEKPVLTGLVTKMLGPLDDFLSWHVFTGAPVYLLLWKKSGEILYTEDFTNLTWRTVFNEPNCYDSEICAISKDYCAIVSSKHDEDGGSLKIISLQFQLVSSEAHIKTTIHKGRGLFYVNDHLFVVGGGRIAFASVTQLDKQLDQYIGLGLNKSTISKEFGALSLYQNLPKLYASGDMNKVLEAMTASIDVPEDLIVDFVDYITDEEKHDIPNVERRDYLRGLLDLELSHTVLAGELTRLSMQQSLLLIELSCLILEDLSLDPLQENRLLSWIDLVLSINYVNTVVSKDERTLSVLEWVLEKMIKLEKEVEATSSLCSIIEALPSLSPTQQENNNVPYSIKIMDF